MRREVFGNEDLAALLPTTDVGHRSSIGYVGLVEIPLVATAAASLTVEISDVPCFDPAVNAGHGQVVLSASITDGDRLAVQVLDPLPKFFRRGSGLSVGIYQVFFLAMSR
jgi:hypothetical protein